MNITGNDIESRSALIIILAPFSFAGWQIGTRALVGRIGANELNPLGLSQVAVSDAAGAKKPRFKV